MTDLSPHFAARRRRTPRCALACLALLAGCTLGPDYKRPDLDVPKVWRAEPAAAAADLVDTEWWRRFGDADLDALIAAALSANKDLKLATLRIAEFDARLQISRAANYPQASYTGLAERQRFSQERPAGGGGLQSGVGPIVNNFSLGAVLNWEIDLWGRVRRANEAALADLLSTEDGRRGVMLTVVTSVATSYVQLLAMDRQLALAERSLSNRRDALALTETRYRGGSATRLAVEQARAAVDAAAAELPLIERDIARAEGALSLLVGRNPGPIQRRRIELIVLPPVPAGVPADVLTRRPDVMAAEQSLIAANARIGVAKTEYFPVLSLGAALGLASDTPRWLFAETARTGLLGAVVSGPLFTGGRIEGDIRQAEAIQQQMAVRYELAVQTAVQEVDDTLITRTKTGDREAALVRRVDALSEAGKLARVRYEGGQSNYFEVLDADYALLAAQSEQALGRRDTALAVIAIYKAMGGGWMAEQDKRRAAAPDEAPR